MADDAAAVSATFKEAMSTLTALREVEKSKKNDEFRARLAVADLTMSLERVEQLWNHGILKRSNSSPKGNTEGDKEVGGTLDPAAAGTSGSAVDAHHPQHHDPLHSAVVSPPLINTAGGSSVSSKASASLSHFAATVATLHERLEAIAEGMSSVMQAAAKGLPSPSLAIPPPTTSEQVLVTITSASSAGDNNSFDKGATGPSSSPHKQDNDAPFATLSPSLRSRGPPVVTLLPAPAENFASPTTSGCFSPRGHRSRGSISISDSVSFIPEELFRPDASDMVSRGTMTRVVMTASTSVQASNYMSFTNDHMVRYAALLEAYCSKEQIEEAKRNAIV
jgi:hypothetical protein